MFRFLIFSQTKLPIQQAGTRVRFLFTAALQTDQAHIILLVKNYYSFSIFFINLFAFITYKA